MNILAVEASTQACSVSILTETSCFTEFELAPQRHANIMLSQVDQVMKKSGLSSEQLDYLAFGEGPGAFTGVRIAAGVIQGLAFGWDKPVINISTLEAVAYESLVSQQDQPVLACLDARMKEIYVQHCWLDSAQQLNSFAPLLLSEQACLDYQNQHDITVGAGDIQTEYPLVVEALDVFAEIWPSAEAIAKIAAQRTERAFRVEDKPPVPVYLRNNVADKKATV